MINEKLHELRRNSLPRVLIIGLEEKINIQSEQIFDYEASELCVLKVANDVNLPAILQQFDPDSIITIGSSYMQFPILNSQSLNIRKKWIHLDKATTNIGEIAYQCASNYILNARVDTAPLISFFTPIHNIGERLLRTYESVSKQHYNNWEWVIVNDSSEHDNSIKIAERLAQQEARIKLYDFNEKSRGVVGEAKYRAAALCQGEYLLELDHDDYLLPEAASAMVAAFQKNPDCKFVYSDCAEIYENHNSITYPEGFAFGYGSYKQEIFNGITYQVANTPNLNPKTIRHIIGVPNHFRAWERKFYHAIGGHNRRLTIADDYELLVRTFLQTKMLRIPKMLYLQFYHDTNTQNVTRKDIQRRVRTIGNFYNERIRERFIALGGIDWAYDFNKENPLLCPSRFGADENAVNYIVE